MERMSIHPAGDEDQCVDRLNLMTIWSPSGDARERAAVPLSRFERFTNKAPGFAEGTLTHVESSPTAGSNYAVQNTKKTCAGSCVRVA